jgi:hypothetical protein
MEMTMNQAVANAIRALPEPLQNTAILGVAFLALSYLAAFFWIRPALWRYIRANLSERYINDRLPTPASRIFFGKIRKKARLDSCGWFTVNRIFLPLLASVTIVHAVLIGLMWGLATPPTWLLPLDAAMLSLLFFVTALLSLIAQPAATMERRARWGFYTAGNLVHALIWEGIIIISLFFWLYVAYFLVLL